MDSLTIDIIAEYLPLKFHNDFRRAVGSSFGIFHISYKDPLPTPRLIEASRLVHSRRKFLFTSAVIAAAIKDRDFAMMYYTRGNIRMTVIKTITEDHVMSDVEWYYKKYAYSCIQLDFLAYVPKKMCADLSGRLCCSPRDVMVPLNDDEAVIYAATCVNPDAELMTRVTEILGSGNNRQFGFTSRSATQNIWETLKADNKPLSEYIGRDVESLEDDLIIYRVAYFLTTKKPAKVSRRTQILTYLYIAITIHEVDGLVDSDLERFLRERHEAWFPHTLIDYRTVQ